MRSAWRSLRRARGRSAASILALALAIAAMGVFAVPTVARDSLRRVAAQDRIAHLTLDTTPIPRPEALTAVPGVSALATRTRVSLPGPGGHPVDVVGIDPAAAPVDVVRATDGRLPAADDEVALGRRVAGTNGTSTATVAGTTLRVVGTADTTALAGEDVVYVREATARRLAALTGPNQVVVRIADPTAAALDRTVIALRRALADQGVVVTALPTRLVGGAHPIEESTTEISAMIGLLGVVAGIVALVLLASTTNAIVTERSRDAAVMRALGAPGHVVRRELRRVAMTIAAVGLVIGLPLGILVSNLIARMVVERFAGITPGIAWSPVVVAASVTFAIVGARLISARAARRLTRLPLAEALRDRDGTPYGRRLGDRVVARLRTGTLTARMAIRSVARRRGRAGALVAQVACAVGAAACVASLVTSVARFNELELASWKWASVTTADDPGATFPASVGGPASGTERGIAADARLDDWEFEVWGMAPDTRVVDTRVDAGRWLEGSPRTAVLASHIARELGLRVGDDLTLELATGPATYRIVGLHPIRGVTAFVDREGLAARLGIPGRANVVWTSGAAPARAAAAEGTAGAVSTTVRRADLYAADQAARTAITGIFVAIGVVVAGVATVGAVTTVGVGTYERRRELAVVRALGARRRGIRRILVAEVAPLALVGWAVGLGAGWLAAKGIMAFFQASSGVALGYTFAAAAVPVAAVAVSVFVVVVAAGGARGLDRRAPASILRAAS